MPGRIFLLILYLLVSRSVNTVAQQGHTGSFKKCPILSLGFEQGLINNETNSIITDAMGFTWISTRSGMQRYNGYSLETVNPVIDGDTVVINTPVFFADPGNGSIHISYNHGMLEYNPSSNSFHYIIRRHASGNSFFSILPLLESSGKSWFIETGRGIVVREKEKEKIIFNSPEVNALVGSPGIFSRTVIAHNDNSIFIRLGDQKILFINTLSENCRVLDTFDANIAGIGASANKLFVTTASYFYEYTLPGYALSKKIPADSLFNSPVIFSCIQPMQSGSLRISVGNNLYEFDSSLFHRQQITALDGEPIVPTGSIHQLYTDKMKRTWLLTNNDVRMLVDREAPFHHFTYPAEKSNYTRSIYYDSAANQLLSGCIDVGADRNGGIRLFDTSGNPSWAKPLVTAQMRNINAIEKLSPHHYLVTTFEHGGWFLADVAKRKIFTLTMHVDGPTKERLLTNAWPSNLQRIDDTTIYVAATTNIFRCIFMNDQLQSAKPLLPATAVASANINCFIRTQDQTIWAGTDAGQVIRMDNQNTLSSFPIPGGPAVRCFAEDGRHRIWIGTDKDIFIFSPGGKLIKVIDKNAGLLSDYIYAILAVGDDSVFASTRMGIAAIPFNGAINNYTKQSGLQSNEFNTGAALKVKSGRLYFGGINGISAFYPSAVLPVVDSPILNITRLQINDSAYSIFAANRAGQSITLSYPQNRVVIDFAAMGQFGSDEYSYAYHLTGLDDDWQYTNHPTGIRYVLQPGQYTFEIRCSVVAGGPASVSKKIKIIVYPAWWHSWWFKTLAFLLTAVLIMILIRRYNHLTYQRNIRQLELTNKIQQERERISRDLHDNMGAYAAAIAVNVSKVSELIPVADSPALNELQQNAAAIVTQLHDTIWALGKENIQLTSISDRFKVFLQKIQPSYPAINIEVKEDITTNLLFSPAHALHLFRIMQEGVTNAMRHSRCSQVIVSITSHQHWIVAISDNGKGMDGLHRDGDSKQNGNGLENIKRRAAEAGWQVSWNSRLSDGTDLTIQPQR